MNKARFQNLEKLFAREIQGHIFQPATRGRTPKWIEEFLRENLIEPAEERIGRDRFGEIVCKGYALTHKGRAEYCAACPEPETE